MDILPRQRLMVATAHRNQSTAISKFKALADPIRLQVIELLRQQEMCVCDLCDQIGVAQSKLSFHLKTLREAGLLHSRQQGRWIYYSLNLSGFLELEEYLAEIRRLGTMLPAKVCE
jgi:ArsR family transcriptional regulator